MPLFSPTFSVNQLNGSNGFRLGSLMTVDLNGLGFNVDGIGDVNGDGIDDVLLGANRETVGGSSSLRGAAYVVFGHGGSWTANVDLQRLDGSNGFKVESSSTGRFTGVSVSGAGDIDNDGRADFLVGAERSIVNGVYARGEAYLIYGRDYDRGEPAFPATLSLDGLGGGVGTRVPGLGALNFTGFAVAGGGDFNGDGIDDFVVDGHQASNGDFTGRAYVVFGTASGLPTTFDLASLNGRNGFQLNGNANDIWLGKSLDLQSDINGDGKADLVAGAWYGSPLGRTQAGETYVLFGTSAVRPTPTALNVNGTNGFLVAGRDAGDWFGRSVSTADFNGDGFADVVIGAAKANPGGRADAGEGYVIFGKAGGFGSVIDVRALTAGQGFVVQGIGAGDNVGYTVAGVGDVNGDGIADVAFSAPLADVNGLTDAGAVYVVFGRPTVGTSIDLASLDGDNGFVVRGAVAGAQFGGAVSGAGDLNGDGIDDIVVIAPGTNSAHVIFGRAQAGPPPPPPPPPGTTVIDFVDTAPAAQWEFNGDAALVGGALQLTPAQGGQAGSVFYRAPLAIDADTSFTSQFSFQLLGGTGGGDGFAFVLQNDPGGVDALGVGGNKLGYSGATKIFNSLAITFDTLRNGATNDVSDNQIGVFVNGDIKAAAAPRIALSPSVFDLNGGGTGHAWITYDGATNLLQVFVSASSTQPAAPVLATTVDLAGVVGDQAYAGFTAGTGSRNNAHRILDWQLDTNTDAPPPPPPPPPGDALIAYDGFAGATTLELNGTATVVGGGNLSLTPAQDGQAGSAFHSAALSIGADTSFQTEFDFRIAGGDGSGGADGFAFVLQNDGRGIDALGTGGNKLGYSGAAKIFNSLAITFDTQQNGATNDVSDNQIGVFVNGDIKAATASRVALDPGVFDLNGGSTGHVWIDYDGTTDLLEVFIAASDTQPATAVLSTTVDLANIVGGEAFAGFTAGTGSTNNAHEIIDWSLTLDGPLIA